MIKNQRLRLLPEVLLLVVLGGLIVNMAQNGLLSLYIHPRYHLWIGISGAVLALGGVARFILGQNPVRFDLLLLPTLIIILVVIIPARPLGASLIPSKKLSDQSNASLIARFEQNRSDDTLSWSLLDWTAAFTQEGVAPLEGKPVSYEGFIFRDETLPEGAVFVGRYVVTCCTADGRALALAVLVDDPTIYPDDQWVRVEGTLVVQTIDGVDLPLVEGSLTTVDTPKVPYLYP